MRASNAEQSRSLHLHSQVINIPRAELKQAIWDVIECEWQK
jgi:hypothetical protein